MGYFLNKIFDFVLLKFQEIPFNNAKKKKKKFEQTMQDPKFIKFQTEVLMSFYGQDFFTYVFGNKYPVYCIGGNVNYPFKELCIEKFSKENNIQFQKNKYYKKYKKVIEANIKRPKMQGFMLDRFLLDVEGKIVGMKTWVGTYDENVYTSHILEYELYEEYLKCKIKPETSCLKNLTLRNEIHNNLEIEEVLVSGCNRAALLGVQLLIVFKSKIDGRYQVLTIKRSEDVAAKPGFYQFVPSGGFEVFENSDEHSEHELRENYNILWAIYREYMEELVLGKENDYEYGQGGETIAKIEKEKMILQIKEYIENKTAHFEFLGSVVDLCGLRNELSFVLRIDDVSFGDLTFKSNNESIKINRFFIDEIQNSLDVEKINPSSAALWYLFTQNHLYKEII